MHKKTAPVLSISQVSRPGEPGCVSAGRTRGANATPLANARTLCTRACQDKNGPNLDNVTRVLASVVDGFLGEWRDSIKGQSLMSNASLHPLELILRRCAEKAPDPWYPSGYAKEMGNARDSLDPYLDQLRLGGLTRLP